MGVLAYTTDSLTGVKGLLWATGLLPNPSAIPAVSLSKSQSTEQESQIAASVISFLIVLEIYFIDSALTSQKMQHSSVWLTESISGKK